MNIRTISVAVLAGATCLAHADVSQFTSSKDNTLFESATGGLSNGGGSSFFVGVTNAGELRRGLVQFDLSATVPTGATINGASLRITQDRQGPGGPSQLNVHRVIASWGEGTSTGTGGGGFATIGDATWTHRFHDTVLWTTPGGDFESTVLASLTPGGSGNQSFSSTPRLVSAVQGWTTSPANNFGFIIKEAAVNIGSAARFYTRESVDPATRPMLSVDFTRPVSSWSADAAGTWGNLANWTGGVPSSFGIIARFAEAISAPRTLTVAGAFTVGQLAFDSPFTYTLAGTGPLTLDNGNGFDARIDVAAGSHVVNTPLLSTRNLVVNVNGSAQVRLADLSASATVNKTGSGRLELGVSTLGSLDLQSGTTLLTTPTAALLGGLHLDDSATLDLKHGGLIQTADAGSIDTQFTQRVADISQNRIVSTDSLLVGYAKASDLPNLTVFMNRTVPASSILIRATFAGDGNLDGAVNFDDLLTLAQHYGALAGASWIDGDSTGDGAVNFDDLLALAQKYGSALAVDGSSTLDPSQHDAFAADWLQARMLVPEPGSVFALALVCARRRRVE